MSVDAVIRDFAVAGHVLPRASIQWALDHWDEAASPFVELLDRYADGAERTRESEDALFFIIHILGEKLETRAFPALCRLLSDEAARALDRIRHAMQ